MSPAGYGNVPGFGKPGRTPPGRAGRCGHSFCHDHLTREERAAETEAFYAANPDPTAYEIAERLLPGQACRTAEEPDAFGELLWGLWIGEAITLRQAARIALPIAREVFGEDRAGFAAWAKRWFVVRGLDAGEAEGILREHDDRNAARASA